MALFTSVANGNWNNADTWDGTGYPNTDADDVTIAATHQVTWDRGVDTVAFDDITINGMLVFPVNASWKLLFLDNGILAISAGGEIRTGTTSAPDYMGAAYSGQIHWPQGASARSVFTIANGGIVNLWGRDFPPADRYADLDSDWTTGNTLYVTGDYTAKWAADEYIWTYENTQTYGSNGYQEQGDIYKIYSVDSYDSGNDRTPIVVTAANPTNGASNSCIAVSGSGYQGKVVNITRNLDISDPATGWNVYSDYNTYAERLRLNISQTLVYDLISFKNCMFRGWEYVTGGAQANFSNAAFINCSIAFYSGANYTVSGDIISCNTGVNSLVNIITFTGLILSCNIGFSANYSKMIGDIISCSSATVGTGGTLEGNIIGCATGLAGFNTRVNGNVWSCVSVGYGCINGIITGDCKDYSALANNIISTTGDYKSLILEHSTIAGADKRPLRAYHPVGTILSLISTDTGWQTPDSGNSYILEVTPNSYCSPDKFRRLPMNIKADMGILAPASATTLTVKVYPVGWTTSLDQDDIILEARYLDSASGNTRTLAVNTSQTYANGAWRSVSVTFTPSQAGVVYWNLYIGAYESGDTILIDPFPVIS